MAEIPDVVPGDPIESVWGNPIRDRTVQRYADAATRDVQNPIPVAGDLAYLEAGAVVQYFNGSDWIELLTVFGGGGTFLRLDATNDPITASLTALGHLTAQVDNPEVRLLEAAGVLGWAAVAAGANVGSNGDLLFRKADGTEVFRMKDDNTATIQQFVTAGIRNVLQSTVDPTTEGGDGDVWLTYT